MLKYKHLLLFIVIYAFFLAGVTQYVGLLSISLNTILLSLLCLSFNLITSRFKIVLDNTNIISLIFLVYILITGLLNGTMFVKTFLYMFFILIPLGLSLAINKVKVEPNLYYKIVNFITLLQFPILLIQKYNPWINKYSAIYYSANDGLFGTFPIADDHGLGFFLLCTLGLNLFVFKKYKNYSFWMFNLTIGVNILLIKSNISKVLTILLLCIFIASKLGVVFKLKRRYIFLIGMAVYMIFASDIVADFIQFITGSEELHKLAGKTATSLVQNKTAGRLQTISYFIFNKIVLIIGMGPYSYYDPLNSFFNFNFNFSQIIWFYYDIGLVGVVLFFIWIFSLSKKVSGKVSFEPLLDFIIVSFIVFSVYTTTLNSITILTTFFSTLHFIKTIQR